LKNKITKNDSWDLIIKPKSGWINVDISEIFKYWDLIFLFVKRDFVTFYKQTILGPLWYIIQPLFNTVVFTFIFGQVAKISTDGLPPFLFYLSGNVVWGYFAHCLSETSKTFISNSQVFGKVYFPRITVPISIAITSLFQLTIQFLIFIGFYSYFIFNGASINPTINVITFPLIILHMALLSTGIGMIISALTAKYRDLSFAMGFVVQLWMYLTPIVYPLSEVPEKFRIFILINPMTAVVESFRGSFLGVSSITFNEVIASVVCSIVLFLVGVVVFNRVEKTFMDTV
tara:strand:- start:675 stop:1535 length:861 start_codon:yes stop_codon:yes gene_type:complete